MMKVDYKEKTKIWNKEPVIKKISKPTNPSRARSLGYKAKQGFVISRVRIKKGGRRKPTVHKGRKPRSSGVFFTPNAAKKAIAERRVARKFANLEVLNSYYIGEDGKHKFYEVILLDPQHSSVKKDRERNSVLSQRRRAFRGLTSSAKKSRSLRK